MPSRHEKWIQVRLLREDHERLVAFRDRLMRRAAGNPGELPPWCEDDEVSLSTAIRELIRREDSHLMRSNVASANRTRRRREK